MIRHRPKNRMDKGPQAGAQAEAKAPALALQLGEFKIAGGRIDFTDQLAAGAFHKTLQDLDVSLRKLALPAAAPAELDFGFSTDAGEKLAHQGSLGLAPLRAAGQLELTGLTRLGSSPIPTFRDNIPHYQLLRDGVWTEGDAD